MVYFFKLKKLLKKLSVRASFAALIAVFSALASSVWGYAIPENLTKLLGANSVDNILQIIASNMLVVVTFSLATMVAGYTSASQGVTPRAARILIENQRSENAISIFLGAFIFSTVSIATLSTELYDRGGRFILFVLTCILIFTIVWTIIRWIEDLSKLGRVHETVIKIEKSSESAFKKHGKCPNYYCNLYLELPVRVTTILANEVGYLQNIDFQRLNKLANKIDSEIYIKVAPGSFIHNGSEIVAIKNTGNTFELQPITKEVNNCFVVDDTRSLDNDPLFNLLILSEVASRALSPGVNDPGTAIDSLRSATKVFHQWIQLRVKRELEIKYQKLFVIELTLEECFDELFRPISRDGANNIEILLILIEALRSMEILDKQDSELTAITNKYKDIVLARGLQCLRFVGDKDLLKKSYALN